MKNIIYITLPLAFFSCSEKERKPNAQKEIIPPLFQNLNSSHFVFKNDTAYYNQEKYAGYIYQLDANQDTVLCNSYLNGLMHGVCKKWYPNKKIMEIREYHLGKKKGSQISFWENGNERFAFTADNDVYEGELKEWTFDGQLIHMAHYENGQEEGTQKMWYENGKIRANYVMIKGKRYGLLGTKNCKNVSDSIFVVK